ncbi:MAG TPA: DUF3159 domain-containing protein [Mycobacteriales bacterium]|nr:DUF3159 domain-containing protein [Mycobacteriales bacterium]
MSGFRETVAKIRAEAQAGNVDGALEDVVAARQAGADAKELFGGPRDWVDSMLPVAVFTVAVIVGASLSTALWGAAAAEVVIVAIRLVRRETLRHAFSGVFGVAIAAFFAAKTHNKANFFLPGILVNAVYAVAFVLSVVLRHPLVGVIMRLIWADRPKAWHEHPVVHRAYAEATLGWAAVSALRVVVQEALRRAHQTGLLGVAKIAMGYPLYLAALALTKPYIDRRTRGVPVPEPEAEAEAGPGAEEPDAEVADAT